MLYHYYKAKAMQAIIIANPNHCNLGVDQNWEGVSNNFYRLEKCSNIIAEYMIKK